MGSLRFIQGAIRGASRSCTVAASTNSFSRGYALSPLVAEEKYSWPRHSNLLLYAVLAREGVIVKDKAFYNMKPSDLKRRSCARTTARRVSGLPLHVRGDVITGGGSKFSQEEFTKLLIQVTNHISSVSEVFVQDGAVGSSSKCDATVRIISDSSSALLSLSNVLWKTRPHREVSHLIVYVATSISPKIGECFGLGSQATSGFVAGNIEQTYVVLCRKAFSDPKNVKDALAAMAEPVISARGGVVLSARLFISGDSVALLFAPEDIIKSCSKTLVSTDAGVILSSDGVSPMFQTGDSTTPPLFKLPDAVILASADSSGVLPSVGKLSPGQAVYHFLAGYQNGKFVPAYSKGPSATDPLELAKSLLSKLKDHQIPSYLVNVQEGEKKITGKELVKLVQSALSGNIPPFEPKGGDLQSKYASFVSGKYQELPEEFSF